MAKKKNAEEKSDNFFEELAESLNGETLEQIGKEQRNCIDTGNLAINYMFSGKFVNGGLPEGSIAEFYGPSSSGKSLLAMNLIKGAQKLDGFGVLMDAERAANRDFAKKASKIDPNKMIVLYPTDLKNCFHKIYNVINKIREKFKEKPIFIVVDSLSSLASPEEQAECSLDLESASDAEIKAAGAKTNDGMATRARLISRELRKLISFVSDNNAAVLFISQLRKSLSLYGSPSVTSNGEALAFYCNSRLEIKSTTEIKLKGKDSAIKGMDTRFKLTKSRFSSPRQVCENVRLMFDSGLDPFGGLLTTLLHAERIEQSGSGSYKILAPWCSREEVTFRASKDKNTVPLEVLLENPKLIDAETKEQIQYYIDLSGTNGKDFDSDLEVIDTNEEE